MQILGPSHLAVLVLIPLVTAALAVPARNHPRTRRAIAVALAAVLVLSKVAALLLAAREHDLTLRNALPMHLCDWAVGLLVVTLLTGWRLGYELAYFWGLAGTSQAILTPDLASDFPDPHFLTFFVSHGGVIVAVLFLTFGSRMRPFPHSIVKAAIALNLYLALTALVNVALGANYGYLSAKPVHASLMDHLGPWPWYLASMEALAIVSFLLCYAPFFIADRWRRDRLR